MKIKTYEERLPSYSLCYLLYGDSSGLEEEDTKLIDRFMSEYYIIAKELNGHVVIDVTDEKLEFDPLPAFGKACDTYECNINILY